MVAPALPTAKITSDEFLATADHDSGYLELIEGEVYAMAGGASIPHQSISTNLMAMLFGLGLHQSGMLFHAPLTVLLDEHNSPEPDIFWLSPANPARIEKNRVAGAPDLIIEILSPSTGFRDRNSKYLAYQRAGVKEYWIVDPACATLEVYTLLDSSYARYGVFTEGGQFTSPALTRDVKLTGIFPETPSDE